MNEKIIAPFTQEQVQNLMNFQNSGIHPFTCCGHDGCTRDEDVLEGVLIPYEHGWICPCGKYKQDWAHAFMADPKTLEDWDDRMRKLGIQTSPHNE